MTGLLRDRDLESFGSNVPIGLSNFELISINTARQIHISLIIDLIQGILRPVHRLYDTHGDGFSPSLERFSLARRIFV
jgi:hypothetical protein